MKRLEFFFDFGSPTTYLAHTQMPVLARRTGAEIVYRPMLLGGFARLTLTAPGPVQSDREALAAHAFESSVVPLLEPLHDQV